VVSVSVGVRQFCQPNTPGPSGYGTTCPNNSFSCSCNVLEGAVHGSVGDGTATVTMSVNEDSTSAGAPAQGIPGCSPMFASLLLATNEHPELILNVNGSVCYGPDQSADIPVWIVGGFSAVSDVNEAHPGENYWGMVSGHVRYVNKGRIRVGSMILKFKGNVSTP